ncbi:MAG TPA: Ig-like domain-containing protein [Candidatus Angelobacter sp.]|nr:Ig-like domain-containing protein [Candidatus Angelobacter sp.]
MVTTHQQTLSNLKPSTLYHFQARSTDASSQTKASSDATFTTAADTTPPTVSITSPTAGATLSATVSLTASATDDVAVASVQFKVDNANTGAAITAPPYTYALDTTTLTDGNHVLTASATDTSGNTATSTGVAVKVNNTTPGPSIASLNPASGVVGTPVTITGANFGATQGSSTVKFGATTATATSWSATSIATTVPAGASSGNVVVTVGGVASNGVAFTVTTPAPSITNLNPASGVVGTPVTITGANFGATQGSSTVKFGATTATATSWSATSIATTVPAGASSGNVVVTVGGVASNGLSFTITADTTPPVVTITAPTNNATVSGTITLSATATDPDSPVSFVQFKVDGANVGAQLTTAPYSLSLNTTSLSNATHSLTAVAQDPSGNVGTSTTVTITVSNATAGLPTLIFSTAVPLAIPSGNSWNGPGSCTTSQNCYRVPLPELTIAGATLTMAFTYNSTGGNQVFSVTDDKSNTWTLDTTSSASNSKTLKMYHASNVAAGTSYVNIQITGGTNNDYWQALVAEFFNVGSLDGSSCNTGSSTTISAGSITPTQSGDLIIQAKYSTNTISSSSPYGLPLQTTSFTPGLQPNITWSLASQLLGDGAADQYGIYNSTVPLNPTFTQAASDSYISCAVALQPASAGAAATAIPRVVHQEHDAMPKNAANPWHVGLVVDVPKSAVYLSYVGNDSISSVSSIPAPNVGWTASGADFNGTNGHNHVNFYCAQWTTPPGAVTLSINRSGSSNDSINMIYVVQNGTCNLDVDSGGQAGFKSDTAPLTSCSGCLTPTKQNDFIMANGGQAYCTATGLTSPSGGVFDSAFYTGNTIDGPTQTDENNFWGHFYNGTSLSAITVTWTEACANQTQNWAGRVAAYQSQ